MVVASITIPLIDPVMLRLGPFAIRWYGVAYLAAFVLSYAMLSQFIRRGALRISRTELTDLIGWLALGVLVGGRVGWWLLYHRAEAAEPWYEPLAIWHGGMSFHGGLVGVALATIVWSRLQRAPLLNVADCLALVAPVGLLLGRIANFINAELVGRVTDVPWGMVFPGDFVARHPSQLYEAVLEGPVLLAALWFFRKTFRPQDGRLAALFLIVYGVFRFFVEFTRQPDDQIGFLFFNWMTMGQLLSVVSILVGGVLWRVRTEQEGSPGATARAELR